MLRQRKPMSRGTGFKSKTQPRVRRRDMDPPPPSTIQGLHRGTYSASTTVPAPKTEVHRNRHLLDMAQDKPCLLRVPAVCTGGGESTVACHANWSWAGKGGSRRAQDEYSVWGCWRCHDWLDLGNKASGEEKEAAFMAAHHRQVLEWRRIAADPRTPPADRKAVLWALGHLNATQTGELS